MVRFTPLSVADMGIGAAELREAASCARAFALSVENTELKRGFLELADKWEAEARTLETMH